MSHCTALRASTKRRHEVVRKKFDEFMAPNPHGFRPDMDAVFSRVADEIGYSADYVKSILKS